MKKKKGNNLILLAIILLFSSCDQNRVYEKNIDIPDGIWKWDNVLEFDVDITDTISSHDLRINVRHTSYYQYQNIFFFITTTAPSGASIKDTFECVLADEKGKWFGSGLGDIWDYQVLYKVKVRFPFSGTYIFKVEQAMRKENLPFVMDVGLRVEKSEF